MLLLKIMTAAVGGFAGKAISDLLDFDKAGTVACIAGGSTVGYAIGSNIDQTLFGRENSNKNVTIDSESKESLDGLKEISEELSEALETLTQDDEDEEMGREKINDNDEETVESEMESFVSAIISSEETPLNFDEVLDELSQPDNNGNLTAMQLAFLEAIRKKKEKEPTDTE